MRISIIIPTFNGERTIGRAVESVLNQTNGSNQVEILVVDDCSTDKTVPLCERYGIDVIKNEKNTGGPNVGKNKGLDRATGDVICFLDQDDYWYPDKLQEQIELMKYAPISFTEYESDHRKSSRGTDIKIYKKNETFLRSLSKDFRGSHLPYMSTLMISNKLKNIRFEEEHGMLDWSYILHLTQNRKTVKTCKKLVKKGDIGLSQCDRYRYIDYIVSLDIVKNYQKSFPWQAEQGRKMVELIYATYLFAQAKNHFNKSGFTWLKSRKTIKMYLSTL